MVHLRSALKTSDTSWQNWTPQSSALLGLVVAVVIGQQIVQCIVVDKIQLRLQSPGTPTFHSLLRLLFRLYQRRTTFRFPESSNSSLDFGWREKSLRVATLLGRVALAALAFEHYGR